MGCGSRAPVPPAERRQRQVIARHGVDVDQLVVDLGDASLGGIDAGAGDGDSARGQ